MLTYYYKDKIIEIETVCENPRKDRKHRNHSLKPVREYYREYYQQEKAIEEAFSMSYSACYTGLKTPKNWDRETDSWKVTLTNKSTGKIFSLEYFQGLGHRLIHRSEYPRYDKSIIVAPKPYDILYIIRADNPNGLSYDEWCNDFGYDTDSRKALEIYLACQEQTDNFQKVFPKVNLYIYEPLDNY